jgi:hypothetical protein
MDIRFLLNDLRYEKCQKNKNIFKKKLMYILMGTFEIN